MTTLQVRYKDCPFWKDVVLLGERNRHFVLPEGRKSHCGYRLFSNIVHTKYEI